MAKGSVDIPLTPPGEADGFALVEYSTNTSTYPPHPCPPPLQQTPWPRTPRLYSLSTPPPAPPPPPPPKQNPPKKKKKKRIPLLLSTERTEETLYPEDDPPRRYTVAELLNVILERGIELPDTDDEEGFEGGGMGMGEEEEVLREIEAWEQARADAAGKGIVNDEVESPTSKYSFDECNEQKKNRMLSALSTHLAMNEHVVDIQKVLREAGEAEARGEGFDMVRRVRELQSGRAVDCGGWLMGWGVVGG
ncbi:hypothetical protein G7Y79_00019g047200 [Physcia stellaris]|nr:hypothetical protein G7Y79_00019g047200 [Physcia stellaris]